MPLGVERQSQLSNGARHGRCWGSERFVRIGYQGPAPPPGARHRYTFVVKALKAPLELVARCSVQDLRAAMRGQILEQAQITGWFATESGPEPAQPPSAQPARGAREQARGLRH